MALAWLAEGGWRDSWLPSLLTLPALIGASVLFSLWGDGAATRAATAVVFIWVAFIGVRLIQKGDRATPAAAG